MQGYVTMPYNEKISYKDKMVSAMGSIQAALYVVLAFLLSVLSVLKTNKKRITNIFIVRWGNIYQDINKDGRGFLKEEREKLEGKTIDAKMYVMAKIFARQLEIVLKELEVGKTYTTKTHILNTVKKAEKKKEITINSCKKAEKRILIESIWFLGRKDFLKVLFSKERCRLHKQFYRINFTRL